MLLAVSGYIMWSSLSGISNNFVVACLAMTILSFVNHIRAEMSLNAFYQRKFEKDTR